MESNNTSTPTAEPKVNLASSLNGMPPTESATTPVTPPPVMTPPPVVPPTPPVTPPSNDHKEVRVILPALLLVLIIGAGYYWYASRSSAPAPEKNTQTATTTAAVAPHVEVQHIDLTQATTTGSKLPEGFPTNIPVETSNIKESYKATYTDHGVTQYTLSYTTQKTKEQIWKIYSDFALANGYKVDATSTSQTQGVFDAKSTKGELNVVITSANPITLVQLTYIERK